MCEGGESCGDCPIDCGYCGDGLCINACPYLTAEAPEACPSDCACVPDCRWKECGDDGCGGSCGICLQDLVCSLGRCVACVPDEGSVEICDGHDNDCDGAIDEGFVDPITGLYDTDHACGGCALNCAAFPYDDGHGACDLSGTEARCRLVCDPGHFDVNGNPSDGCECAFASDEDVPDGTDQDCDGVDGEADVAVFVSLTGSPEASGLRDAPLSSISMGIERARSEGKHDVYVASGLYAESITLVDGVHVYGGYSIDFAAHDPALFQTIVFGQEPIPQEPAAVIARNIEEGATFAGFVVYGASSTASSTSSVAIFIQDCTEVLKIRDCVIIAGDGADGERGIDESPGDSGVPGTDGIAAYDIGASACTTFHDNTGGAGREGRWYAVVTTSLAGPAVTPSARTTTRAASSPRARPTTRHPSRKRGAGRGRVRAAGSVATRAMTRCCGAQTRTVPSAFCRRPTTALRFSRPQGRLETKASPVRLEAEAKAVERTPAHRRRSSPTRVRGRRAATACTEEVEAVVARAAAWRAWAARKCR